MNPLPITPKKPEPTSATYIIHGVDLTAMFEYVDTLKYFSNIGYRVKELVFDELYKQLFLLRDSFVTNCTTDEFSKIKDVVNEHIKTKEKGSDTKKETT